MTELMPAGSTRTRTRGIEHVSDGIPDLPAPAGPFPIVDVAGHPPARLTDFDGATAVVVDVDGRPRRLIGRGGLSARGMEFVQEFSAEPHAGAGRTWAILQDLNESFWAEPLSVE